jgi:hypothetical protein
MFITLGIMLMFYGAYYEMFPYAEYATGRTWQMRVKDIFFLLMVVGVFGFVASLIWWFASAIAVCGLGSRPRAAVAPATLSALGLVTVLCLCGGNLPAQDDNGGGPGGPPPGQPGDGGPGGAGDSGGNGGPGGPPPGNFGNGGPGGSGNFDPAQFQQRMMEQTRQSLNVTNDDEWTAIEPLVQKVMDARREAGGPGGPGGRGRPGAQASSEQQALQKAIDAGAPVAQIKDALTKYRAERKDKQAKLEAAQNELKNVLSVKQEAQAVLVGLLP